MVRCIALKAAGFKAGVAIPTRFGDGDDSITQPHPHCCKSLEHWQIEPTL